jgi:hypothetical protein
MKELVMRHARTVAVSVVVAAFATLVALMASVAPALAGPGLGDVPAAAQVCGSVGALSAVCEAPTYLNTGGIGIDTVDILG